MQENRFKPSVDWQIFWTLILVAIVVAVIGVVLSKSGVKALAEVGKAVK